jgi:RHS repeat-associated protein
MPVPRGRLTGLTNRTQSAILDAYQYEYDTATMISAITRNQQKMSFAYDKTYQLTSETGCYASNFVPFVSFVVSNQFAYDDAGNRIMSVGAGSVPRIYLHTPDNQLTTICWNAASITLRGRLDNAWTADWVNVKHQMALQWTPATLRCERGQPVRWEARDVPVSVTLPASFNVQAHTPDGQTISEIVSYSKINGSPGSIAYTYDDNGNRTRKTRETGNSTLETWYDYDTDNQLTRIREWSNSIAQFDYTYAYDPFGRRISATENGVTRHFAHDGLDCITELDSNANVKKWFLRGTGLGGGIADIIAEVSPTTTNYYCYNHRGDVVGLVSKAGVLTARYEYTAFGSPITDYRSPITGSRFIGFSSKEFDQKSSLSYYGYRFYDANSGRWMTKDPMLWLSDHNLYRFVINNAISFNDQYGLFVLFGHALGHLNARDYGLYECRPISGYFQHCVNNCTLNRISSAISPTLAPIVTYATALTVGGDWHGSKWEGEQSPAAREANRSGIYNSYNVFNSCISSCAKITQNKINKVCCPYHKHWMLAKDDPNCCPD